ncbi:MAG TPA: O-antigen ligase family protein [Thermoleophilaceae bacterium]|nr:O-antigen ligase family protein [Thermoleophilaceae bacterium]
MDSSTVERSGRIGHGSAAESEPRAGAAGALPAALLGGLLVLGTFFDGAFQLRYWAPIALLGVVLLGALTLAGGARAPNRWTLVALSALWGFAAWDFASMAWAHSPGLAFEGANRTLLYAALASVVLVSPLERRQLLRLGYGAIGGVCLIAVITLARLLAGDVDQFLAGRLDAPIGYRNATASLFALAVWPLVCAAAPRGVNAALRGGCLALATLCLSLAFLTQSRGVLLGLVAGGVVALALGPDRLRRAWLAILVVVAVAAASPVLLDPYDAFDVGRGTVTAAHVDRATVALAALTAAVFLVGLMLSLFDNGLRTAGHARARGLAAGFLAIGAVAATLGAAASFGNPVDFGREKLDEFRAVDGAATGGTRLGSVSGQRYDLWSVAWREFKSEPVTGVGESNYVFDYYAERDTDRNLSDPHSLPVRLLAETGAVGLGLFLAFVGALAWPLARRIRASSGRTRRWAAGLAAAGAATLAQTTVDWLWLVPGVTGLGIFCLALAARISDPGEPGDERRGPRWRRALPAAGLAAAGLSLLAVYLSDFYLRDARAEAGRSPQAQLDAARKAERLNPWSVRPHYVQASALETLGKRDEARAELLEALEQEPRNFATLGLLGDLEARAGRRGPARAYYRRASALNPVDVGLRMLAEGRVTGG